MSGNVIEIPQSKRLAPILRQQLRVVAYCRVSTGHEEQQNSLKNQIEFYTEYIQRNPYWRFVAVYYDIASGLRTNHRSGYQQLLKDCRRKQIDLILVKSLSWFGRDTVETIKQIRRLKCRNIGVYSETGGIDTLTTSDSIIDQLAALDQAESQSRSENIKFGIRHRMRSGKTLAGRRRLHQRHPWDDACGGFFALLLLHHAIRTTEVQTLCCERVGCEPRRQNR